MLTETIVVHPNINLVQRFGLTVRGRAPISQTTSAIFETPTRELAANWSHQ